MKRDKDCKILFVCSANVARSKTGEDVFKKLGFKNVKSAGAFVDMMTFRCSECNMMSLSIDDEKCRICGAHNDISADSVQLTKELYDWADVVYVMEQDHLEYIVDHINSDISKVHICRIPDNYSRGAPVLVKFFKHLAKMSYEV